MTIEEMEEKLERACNRINRIQDEGATHEELADAYEYAFDLAEDVARMALDKLRTLTKKESP